MGIGRGEGKERGGRVWLNEGKGRESFSFFLPVPFPVLAFPFQIIDNSYLSAQYIMNIEIYEAKSAFTQAQVKYYGEYFPSLFSYYFFFFFFFFYSIHPSYLKHLHIHLFNWSCDISTYVLEISAHGSGESVGCWLNH
jgi:hypothetical protein